MGVYKRKDSAIWWISYSVAGRQRREAAGTTKAHARALLAKRQSAIFEGTYFPDKQRALDFEGLRTMWFKHAASKRTIADDRQRFQTIVSHFGPDTMLSSIKRVDVEAFRTALAATITRRGTPMAPATVNRHLVLLNSALNLAVQNQHLARNLASNVRKLREHNKRDRHCTEDEYARLIEHATADLRLAIVIAYHTAMRLGEITELNWCDITLAGPCPRIVLRDGTTKTGVGREVPVSQALKKELQAVPRALDGRLFKVKGSSISPAFARLCRRLGIAGLRFHDLRHTTATNLRRAGADPFTIAAITGHKSMGMLQRYNTITIEDKHEAVARVGSGMK